MLSDENYMVLADFRSKRVPMCSTVSVRIISLRENGYLHIESENGKFDEKTSEVTFDNYYAITTKGEDALSEVENVRNKEAAEKRQQHFSNKLAVLGIAVSILAFILGMLAEHFSGVVEFFVSSLH